MKQLNLNPTHIHGNTLNRLCGSRPDHVMNTAVKRPDVSGDFIKTGSVILDVSTPTKSGYTVKLYRDVDMVAFQQDIEKRKHKLLEINNVDDMCTLFSSTLLRDVNEYVSKKTKYNPLHCKPMCDSRKMTKKQRIPYNKQKKTCEPYDRKQYLECRRNPKKPISKIMKDYVENHTFKPLKKGNSKPFYQHLVKMFRLTRPDATMATDATD